MNLHEGAFSPDVKIGIVSASRGCFPRSLAEKRLNAIIKKSVENGVVLTTPNGDSAIIENKTHAADAAAQLTAAGCDAAILFLGNFSPEIEDANFVKQFPKPVMVIAAAEESGDAISCGDRGDALCGLLSAAMAIEKRRLSNRVYIPALPIVSADAAVAEIERFVKIMKVCKGISNSTIGLFGPRPRDFETCNYSQAVVSSIGVEIEEHSLNDLINEINDIERNGNVDERINDIKTAITNSLDDEHAARIASYEQALVNMKKKYNLSGATTQCWIAYELQRRHVPCYAHARLTAKGYPIACENDVYSLIAELMAQYASDSSVSILDLNHSIPSDYLTGHPDIYQQDVLGMFHCGNTDPSRLKNPKVHFNYIMRHADEPNAPEPDISVGTIEGQIAASPATIFQVGGCGDDMIAYIAQGDFLDIDPRTFGSTGTLHIPGFARFYRHVLLGRFHHHCAIAFSHCGGILFDALKLLGVGQIYTPNPAGILYPGENPYQV